VRFQALDREVLRHWASALGVAETLDLILEGKLSPQST
jgi:hypothetical protein